MKRFHKTSLLRMLALVMLAGLLLTACAPSGAGAGMNTPEAPITGSTPDATPSTGEEQKGLSSAAQAAINDLAAQTGISMGDIRVIKEQPMQWSDSCLGLGGPAESCLQVITEGYLIVLEAGGETFEYHTDTDGSQLRTAVEGAGGEQPQDGVLPEGELPAAATNARDVLAQQLGIDIDEINIVSVEAVDWPNGCLGIEEPGLVCTQAIVPGYRVLLEVDGNQYEFRTDREGGIVKLAQAPMPEITGVVVVWEQTEETTCSRAEISAEAVLFGECGGTLTEASMPEERLEELVYFVTTYAGFSGGTPAGSVTLTGQGTQQPAESEQRSLAEWARMVSQEAQGEQSEADLGLAFTWHREGGIAGFCDDLEVFLSGWAQPSSCKANQEQDQAPYRLNADELEQLYTWVDQFASFEYELKDPATADAMTTRLVFSGSGSEQAAQAQQEQVAALAANLLANAAR